MTFKNKKQLEEEIRKLGNGIIDLIKVYDLRKPYHKIDIWEMQNVAEATLNQTNEIIKMIEDFMENKGVLNMVNNTRMWDVGTQKELLTKLRGELT
ncbi:hypothetical protein LCGC14_2325550 [marine sediment metagenome]|uniref:Uncharacterized protein n=1 Tax=marine sediment metagenome TaxID=412755 RepID=A0A0F9FBH0_9ZZZZ